MASGFSDQTYWKEGHQAENYNFMETVTGEFAKDLVTQSQFPKSSTSNVKVFDNASGAGAITAVLYSDPYSNVEKEVLGGDISPGMIEQFKKRSERVGWKGARGEVIDAMETNLSDSTFDYVFTNFAVFAFPNSRQALKEMIRITKSGGTISFTTWEQVTWPGPLKAAAQRLSLPPIIDLNTLGKKGDDDWTSPSFISSLMTELGLKNVQAEISSKEFPIDDPEVATGQIWKGMSPLLLHGWSDDQKSSDGERLRQEWAKDLRNIGNYKFKMVAILCKGVKP